MDAGEDGEILADLPVEAGFGDFFPEDGIAFTDDLRLVGGDFADDADGDAGAGEGLAPDQFLRETQGFAQGADFILEGRPPTL